LCPPLAEFEIRIHFAERLEEDEVGVAIAELISGAGRAEQFVEGLHREGRLPAEFPLMEPFEAAAVVADTVFPVGERRAVARDEVRDRDLDAVDRVLGEVAWSADCRSMGAMLAARGEAVQEFGLTEVLGTRWFLS
jgi:hypothetical protein